MGRIPLPQASLRITMGILVIGSIIRPRIFISTSKGSSLLIAKYILFVQLCKPLCVSVPSVSLCLTRLHSLQELLYMLPCGIRHPGPAHHPDKLFNPGLSYQGFNPCDGPAVENNF